MNLILLRADDAWTGDRLVRLTDRRADHIRAVLRAQVGDVLRVGLLAGEPRSCRGSSHRCLWRRAVGAAFGSTSVAAPL